MKVLLVDDMTLVGHVIIHVIESFNRKLLQAGNPIEAFQILQEQHKDIDLILLDWHMPQMLGIDFLQQIKSIPEYQKIPVIMLTSNMNKSAIAQAFSGGAAHYILKPFNLEDLKARIKDVYDKIYLRNNIMLVDDSKLVIVMLTRLLNKMGYQVNFTASDGVEAVELFKEKKPSLVFLDINMPNMDGLSALKAIRDFYPMARVICMSSNQHKDVEEDAMKLGAAAFIRKPFEEMKIFNALVDAMS
jgi:two-component system chemotaxis response regulator CheY